MTAPKTVELRRGDGTMTIEELAAQVLAAGRAIVPSARAAALNAPDGGRAVLHVHTDATADAVALPPAVPWVQLRSQFPERSLGLMATFRVGAAEVHVYAEPPVAPATAGEACAAVADALAKDAGDEPPEREA